MSLNDNQRVSAIADSPLLSLIVKGMAAVGVPIIVLLISIQLSRSSEISDRLTRIETTVNLSVPGIYPRGEALAQFGVVNARIDGVVTDVQSNTHRIGALEAVRDRLRP